MITTTCASPGKMLAGRWHPVHVSTDGGGPSGKDLRFAPVSREVLEAGVLLGAEVVHGGLQGGVVARHDVLLRLQGALPLLPLPPRAPYLGAPLA